MDKSRMPTGIALICDSQGTIQKLIHDGIGLAGLKEGNLLSEAVDSGSRIKLLNFMVGLRDKGAVFDWETVFLKGGRFITLRLAGIVDKEKFVIVGAQDPGEILNLWEELMVINNEQATALRSAIKSLFQSPPERGERDADLYEEISRLNNELVNLQRDLAKKNAELKHLYDEVQSLAITDPLTGLYNRRGFFELGIREIERSLRFNRPLAVIMFDLDNFKTVNDHLGHSAGDQVLTDVAARCSGLLRKVDIFGRYGGDEFSVILPETPQADAYDIAERLRQVAASPVRAGGEELTLTLSLGVAALRENTAGLQELLDQADRALYLAKESGRNRVEVEK